MKFKDGLHIIFSMLFSEWKSLDTTARTVGYCLSTGKNKFRKLFIQETTMLTHSRKGISVLAVALAVAITLTTALNTGFAACCPQSDHARILTAPDKIVLQSASVTRSLSITAGNLETKSLQVNGTELLESAASEFAVTVRFAKPNKEPVGIKPGESGLEPKSTKIMDFPMKSLKHEDSNYVDTKGVDWVNPVAIDAKTWSETFENIQTQVYSPCSDVTRLVVTANKAKAPLKGLHCRLTYEVYDGFPVVRKWVSVCNHGDKWIKLEKMDLEGLALKPEFRNQTEMAPGAFEGDGPFDLDIDKIEGLEKEPLGWVIGPSVVAFSTKDGSKGLIASSEIPSAMRQIYEDGSMGYRRELFEWVLGPGEKFTSEPVFYFAFRGKTHKTASAVSTPRDRAVERPYRDFMSKHIGIVADNIELNVPLFSIWEATWRHVNDEKVREQAKIAARCGFKQFEIDAGWQWDNLGTRIDKDKFPDLLATSEFIQSLGMELSLWVSNYRTPGSRDLELMPDARAVPLRIKPRKLGIGYGMSWCTPWRRYFARDLVCLHQQYGITGYKEDHTNIRGGDIGYGHESRTRKESLLRSFRGLLEAQKLIHDIAPEILTEISHEIYWDNPSPGCDIAALKNSVTYHIPPNTHYGSEDFFRVAKGRKPRHKYYQGAETAAAGAKARREAFLTGCKVARERIFAHRALPTRCLQFYALVPFNRNGSLTTKVQDRQVCSLLMGAPFLFSGDLTTLNEEHINRYAERFKLLERLQDEYNIYRHFQFSGVPEPTDTGWHWWGKLNKDGYGAVPVLRGSAGEKQRIINIPWVNADKEYKVRACFAGKDLGTFTGKQLREGAIKLALATYGQEILEIAPK